MMNRIVSLVEPTLVIVVILSLTFVCVRMASKLLAKYFPVHHLYSKFLKHILNSVIYFIGIVIAISTIPQLKSFAYSLLASSGVIALVVGFAMQQTFSNVVTGLLLVVTEPFKLNDRIRIGENKNVGNEGIVEDINLRYTILRADDGSKIIIPNAYLQDHVVIKIAQQ